MKILDALLGRSPTKPSSFTGQTGFSTSSYAGQPVPVSVMVNPPSNLTAGSSLNHAAIGAWPTLRSGSDKFVAGWVSSKLREVAARNLPGNYGMITSRTDWLFRPLAFDGIAGLPYESWYSRSHEYNELTPTTWQGRVPKHSVSGHCYDAC